MSYSLAQRRRVQRVHNRRSLRAKRVDERLRAPIAKTAEQWLAQPNRFDLPDVDTPKHAEEPTVIVEPVNQHRRFTKHSQRQAMRRVSGNLR